MGFKNFKKSIMRFMERWEIVFPKALVEASKKEKKHFLLLAWSFRGFRMKWNFRQIICATILVARLFLRYIRKVNFPSTKVFWWPEKRWVVWACCHESEDLVKRRTDVDSWFYNIAIFGINGNNEGVLEFCFWTVNEWAKVRSSSKRTRSEIGWIVFY